MSLKNCRLRTTCLFLAIAGSGALALADERPGDAEPPAEPLLVQAWIRDGRPRARETRILGHLADFDAPAAVPLSRFGGWIGGGREEPTGFFYPKRIGDRWWLIDPEGYRYLKIGVNSVRAGRSPKNRRVFPERFGTMEAWRDATLELLAAHGFRGTGSWSDDVVLAEGTPRPVYTPNLNFMSGYGRRRGGTYQLPGHTGYPSRCMFVFDPEFEQYADERASELAERKDDPYLLGYFSDNELPFPSDSLDRYLQLDTKDPGRQAAERWWAERRDGADRDIADADRRAWLGYLADRYYSTCARAIKRHAPNHLYLGSRLYSSERNVPELMQAAGRHVDVIAVNLYGAWQPSTERLRQWSEWSGRPLLLTEWYAKGADSGMSNLSGAGWTVPTQEDRGHFYQTFTLALLESQVCVGWHWFKYMDNDPEDKAADPSNIDSNKGIVTTAYEPYTPLLDAMRQLNAVAYPLTEYFDRR